MATQPDSIITADQAQAICDALNTLTPQRWGVRPPRTDMSPWEQDRYQALDCCDNDALLQGAAVYIRQQQKGRLECYGHRHAPEREYLGDFLSKSDRDALHTTITVSANKTPAQIARDIVRRLLPPYFDSYGKATQGRHYRHSERMAQNSAAHQLAAILGPGARVNERKDLRSEASVWYARPGAPSLTLRVYVDTVRVEYMSLTAKQAQIFAALVATWAHDTAPKGHHIDTKA